MDTNIFMQASRLKLRFDSPKGQLAAEDLWDLPLTSAKADKPNLDDIAKSLYRKLRESANVMSFVEPAESDDSTDQLRFDIVKTVIDTKVEERNTAKAAADRSAKKQKLLEILERKQNQELEGMSPEQLRAMISEL